MSITSETLVEHQARTVQSALTVGTQNDEALVVPGACSCCSGATS